MIEIFETTLDRLEQNSELPTVTSRKFFKLAIVAVRILLYYVSIQK